MMSTRDHQEQPAPAQQEPQRRLQRGERGDASVTRAQVAAMISEAIAKISITGTFVEGSNGRWVVKPPKLSATGSGRCDGNGGISLNITVTAS